MDELTCYSDHNKCVRDLINKGIYDEKEVDLHRKNLRNIVMSGNRNHFTFEHGNIDSIHDAYAEMRSNENYD